MSAINASSDLPSSISTKRRDSNAENSPIQRSRPASLILSMQRKVPSDNKNTHCGGGKHDSADKDKNLDTHLDTQDITQVVEEDTESSTYHGRRRRAANTCSWSSTSSSFSTSSSSTLSTVATPIAILTNNVTTNTEYDTLALLEEDDDDELNVSLNDDHADENDELDEQAIHERQHQRRWRRRVTKSLCRASSNGDAFLVRQILTDERLRPFLNINVSDDERDGTTPLIYAACFGKAEVVQILLESGARADLQDKLGWTALMWATTNNHSAVVALLLEHGASSETRSAQGRTALDFVNAENEQMVHIIQRRESMPATTQQVRARRRSSVLSTLEDTDFYYNSTAGGYNHFMANESERRRVLMEAVEEHEADDRQTRSTSSDDDADDLASCVASMHSVHKFIWDQCLPDQMFVFSEDNASHILDTAITNITLPMKSRQEIWVPANIIFLCSRFAHYFSSRELLHDFLNSATTKIAQVLKSHENDIHTLAFWMANLSQLLYYLKKDPGLVVATAEHQLQLSELISETYMLMIYDSESRIDKILEPAMLEHEPIDGFTQVEFADDWHRFFRRRPSRRSAPPPPKNVSATPSPLAPPIDPLLPRTLCPQTIVSLLSSILYVLQSYEVHPAIIIQGIAQLFHFLSCEIFNRILTHKRYMCRSKAIKIRMNLSIVEEWAHDQTLPGNLTTYFSPLIQLLQLLQCVSQLNDLMAFINTTKAFELLNPLQIKRCVLNYRYEVTESRLPEEIEKYTMQIAQDTVRNMHKRQSSASDPGDTQSIALSRPTSVSSLGSLFISSLKDRKRLSLQNTNEQTFASTDIDPGDSIDCGLENGVDHDGAHEWVVEKRDSKYMLPFSLPNTATASAVAHGLVRAAPKELKQTTPRQTDERGRRVSEAMYLELKQKMGAEREKTAREYQIIPTIPEDWMCRLDDKLNAK